MQYVCVQAPAKVNLALRVGAPRADGFHPLDTVFEALNLYETLEAWNDPSGMLSLNFSPDGYGSDLPTDESNLAIRAGLALKERCSDVDKNGTPRGARMRIVKKIPIAGGMAGGSADAAAALVALNELWELKLSHEELMQIGAELGSDVPFAMMGGIAHGTSRGENLAPALEGRAENYVHGFVMLMNSRGLSTPAVFGEFDRLMAAGHEEKNPDSPANTEDLRKILHDHPNRSDDTALSNLGRLMLNDLETPAFSLRSDLGELVAQLRADIAQGCSEMAAAILSGSGPTIAVLCQPQNAPKLAQKLSVRFPELSAVPAYGPALGARVIETK